MTHLFRLILVTILCLVIGYLGQMGLLWLTSMMFQIINYWVAVVLLIISLTSYYNLSKLYLIYIPYLYFRLRSKFTLYILSIIVVLVCVSNILFYKQLNTFYFPNWTFILLNFVGIASLITPFKLVGKIIKLNNEEIAV